MLSYFFKILVSVDQLLNAFLNGNPDETLSSRMGRLVAKNKCLLCKGLCWFLGKLESDHCNKSIELHEGKNS